MAFVLKNFNNWSSGAAAGPKSWAYVSSADTTATCLADDYFLEMGNALDAGDTIYLKASDGTGTFTVKAASASTVTMGSSVGVATLTVTVPTASVLILVGTAYELVPAPGAGKILYFEGAHLQLDYNSVQYTEAADNLQIAYTSGAGVVVSTLIETTGFIDQAADTSTRALPVLGAIVANAANENAALVLDNNNANFAAGDSDLVIDVFYRVVDGV
jgi:hypothetical protein